MQCHGNLILPILVPAVSYLLLKSFSSGLWDPSSASSGTTQLNGGALSLKMKEDLDKEEMKRWSLLQNLRINDPNYNPFIMKHQINKSLLCDCGNCIKARMKALKTDPPMINLD